MNAGHRGLWCLLLGVGALWCTGHSAHAGVDAASQHAMAVPPTVATRLTPDDATRLAIARSDAVRRARLEVEVARVQGTALSLASPELQIGHRSLQTVGSQVDPFDDSQVGVSWQPPALADFGLKQAIGVRDAEADLSDVDDVAVGVAIEVRTLHAQVLSLQAERSLAAERVTLLDRMVSLQERRLVEQLGTALDVELTALDALDARAELADVDADLARVGQRLARLLGETTLPALAPPSSPLCALPTEGLATLLDEARTRSPRLRALRVREDTLGLRETRAWLRVVPWIDNVQLGAISQQSGRTDVRARIDVAVPLFAPLGPDLRLVTLERELLVAERRAVERDLEEKVRAAWDRLAGFAHLAAVHAGALDRVQASEHVVGRALAAEVVDTMRVITVQQRVLSARRQAVRSRARCDDAAIALAAAAGHALAADGG
jgi:outer membrane protein TolC